MWMIETCLLLVLNPVTLCSQAFRVANKVLREISAVSAVECPSQPVCNYCSAWTGSYGSYDCKMTKAYYFQVLDISQHTCGHIE